MSRDDTGVPTVEAPPTIDERNVVARPPATTGDLLANRYRVARRIGKGGMGEVMNARDEQIGRDVAVKRMKAANPSARAIARFLREATVQGRLEHPAIPPVHEIGSDTDGSPYFVMKKLTGVTLAQLLEDASDDPIMAPLPLQRVLRAFTDVCIAVEFAHVRGIVHRDLKPENIMLGDFGEVYVLDWGVAKVIGEDDGEFADVDSSSGEHATVAGTAIGTPGFMAPEQARGISDIDGRADVYTLGCLLFEVLSGEPLHPRGYDGIQSAIAGVDARPSVRAPDRTIPPELDALCVQATASDRRSRPTARELGERVQRFLDGDRDLAMRRGLAKKHLEIARAAFHSVDAEASRRIAGAAELVGRLMLEPPRTTPPEVEQAIRQEEVHLATVNSWAGIWSIVTALVFLPLVFWISPQSPGHVVALGVSLLVNLGMCVHAYRSRQPRPGLLVLGNTVLVTVTALLFSPVLVAPAVAAVLGMALALTPRFSVLSHAVVIGGLMTLATMGPLVLERLDIVDRTLHVDGAGVVLTAPAYSGHEAGILIAASLYIIALIAGATAMGDALRSRTRTTSRHLHLQAWQLRQLVPQT
jgi:eukaryotic-like serine/threonine-protein kinase